MGDTVVTQAFPCGAAITTADHQHPFNRLGTTQGRMDQGFVVMPFLVFGCHPAAIEQQSSAVALTPDHADLLKRAGLFH